MLQLNSTLELDKFMTTLRQQISESEQYLEFLKKRLNSENFKKNVSKEEFDKTKYKYDKEKLKLKMLKEKDK